MPIAGQRLGGVVGRQAELKSIERFLDKLPSGPACLLIEGNAGIGKSTLWLEAVRTAESRGYRVLSARPSESEASLSYAVLADLIADVFGQTRAQLPPPQARALAVALLQDDADQPIDERTTATALLGVLAALARDKMVLVAVDDVQWIDAASARALRFALRRSPLQIGALFARRSSGSGETAEAIEQSFPADRLERIAVGPLSLAALYHLIASQLGRAPARPTLARINAASAGNAFFALELARALATQGQELLMTDRLLLPKTVQQAIASRLRGLSVAARQVVLAAAALSRPSVATIARALAPELDATFGLAEAEEAEVLVSTGGRLRFTHPLLASAVYGAATAARRRRLHCRLAEVVSDAEERVRHLALGTTDADENIAVELERVATGAVLKGAPDTAAELYEASCRLTPEPHAADLARRLLGGAEALLAVGDNAAARELGERAVASSPELTQKALALALLGRIDWLDGDMPRATARLKEALRAATADDELQGRLYAELARFGVLIDPHRAAEHAAEAARLLSEDRSPDLLAGALIDRFFAEVMLGHGAREDMFARALQLEVRAGRGTRHIIPLVWFHFTDAFEAARARHAEEESRARSLGLETMRLDRLGHLGMAEWHAGRWDLAEQYIDESCSSMAEPDALGPFGMRYTWRSLVDAGRGRTVRARSTLASLIDEFMHAGQEFWAAMSLGALGFVEFADGNYEAVDSALNRMQALIEPLGVKEAPLDRSQPFHIEALVALGQLDRAEQELERLEWRGRTLPRLWISATLPRARALIRAAHGDVAAALAAIEDVDVATAQQLPFELGWTLLVKGRLHRRARQKRAAVDAFRPALTIFESLGAVPWVNQTRSELDRVGIRRRSSTELTPAERRIAELAAVGLTNREVAQLAFVSPKTVEANLGRVYGKLGIRSRAELGAIMATHSGATGMQT